MIVPFINFAGRAGEAIAFYETVFEITDKQVFLFKDMPEEMKRHFPRETDHYVMHAEMTVGGTKVWIGDTVQGVTSGDMVSLSVPLATTDEVRAAFDKLNVGGEVLMELEKTFYSPLFGTVKDKFGIIWHLICQ
ncbi:MAG: VOC family protein [Rikenellaceae bacterium]|jgi:PhnB protein|nr:VOC family protein [Rikenellaceae bacterium]